MNFYTQNGLLNMLDRNKRIKRKPEKFQKCNEEFDLIVTCQERVFDQVLERELFLATHLDDRFFYKIYLTWGTIDIDLMRISLKGYSRVAPEIRIIP